MMLVCLNKMIEGGKYNESVVKPDKQHILGEVPGQ